MLTIFDLASGHIIEQLPAGQPKSQARFLAVSDPKNHPQVDLALQTMVEAAPRDGQAHLLAEDCLNDFLRDTE